MIHRASTAVLCTLAWLGSCAYVPAPTQPRPTLPPLAALRATAPTAAPQLTECADLGGGLHSGRLEGDGEQVVFQLQRAAGDGGHPLVLLVPILAGGGELMHQVSLRMCARGFDVAYCERAGSALKPPQRGPELQELFRRTVLHQRLLLAWLRGPDQPRPSAVFVLGMSIGGMIATAVAAAEPDLDGVAICLSGGDLADMVRTSSEPRVRHWVAWRQREDGVGNDHLQWELDQYLRLEPLGLAAAVPTRGVLFVSAQFDDVVPRRNQDLLWEALGRPARLFVPLGHYSAALAIDPILSAAADHFMARLSAAARPPS